MGGLQGRPKNVKMAPTRQNLIFALRVLVTLESEGEKRGKSVSLGMVGEVLGVSQPTITHHIRALEEVSGMTLVERFGRSPLSLTEQGRQLVSKGKPLIILFDDLFV